MITITCFVVVNLSIKTVEWENPVVYYNLQVVIVDFCNKNLLVLSGLFWFNLFVGRRSSSASVMWV